MWTVFESRAAEKALDKAPYEVVTRFQAWKAIVELSGPQGLRAIKGFHDEALKGQLAGKRSSRLGIQWRVVYTVKLNEVRVDVESVTAHKYKK